MVELIGWAFLLLYIFLAYRFFINSATALMEYRKRESRRYEIIPGTIVDFEQRRVSRPRRSGKRIVFYPVFEYRWRDKTYRKFARRIPAKIGPGFTAVPRTDMQVGDAVKVRIFPKKPSDARLEETNYFWKSRIWGHFLAAGVSGIMLIYGIYCAICQLIPG